MSPVLIAVGIVAGFTFLLWPVFVVNPNGIRFDAVLKFAAPFVICISLYWGIIYVLGLEQFSFSSLGEFWNHISYFSVWYRLVMCACLLGYLVFTMEKIIHCIRKYNIYVEENYSDYEKYTIRWIPVYLGGLVLITVFFVINLCFASFESFLCHNIVACVFMAWLSAKVMVYNSPFVLDKTEQVAAEPVYAKGEDFGSQFDRYKKQVEEWIVNERPYLNADFSLQEIMKRFNLNRTYASKIFNEGFGRSFILVVRDYRIDYAKKIIKDNPAVSMTEVAHLCGYSTAQSFHKAFVYCSNGVTPGKYAQSVIGKD